MKKSIRLSALLCTALLLSAAVIAQESNNQSEKSKTQMKQVLIDKIAVPANAKEAFIQRMTINRNIIKQLPGFVKDEVYERMDENGDLIFMTVAVWENAEAIKNAKQAVEAEYKRTNFNMPEFLQKFNIKMDRGPLYQPFEN